jgi:Protein of unknown function (DUF5672)
MNKSHICVVIPIYKKQLNEFEVQSVEQCIKVLSEYVLHFIYPEGLNLDFYKKKFPRILHYIFFDEYYFKNLSSYNRLMLSVSFYSAFKKYLYMLVYQTDCYVFRDDLFLWSSKGYDYIGGIWFDDYHGNPYSGAKIWYPGNGGLSLRKIKKIKSLLSSKRPIKNYKQLYAEKKQLSFKGRLDWIKWLILLPIKVLGYENNFNFIAKNYSINEDLFFMEACLIYGAIKVPKVNDVIGFSWDRNPKYLYHKSNQTPFACHGWFRDEFPYEGNKEFWLKHITKET